MRPGTVELPAGEPLNDIDLRAKEDCRRVAAVGSFAGKSTEAMPYTPTLSEPRVRSTVPELHPGTLSCESLRHQSDDRLVALTRAGSERAFSEITRRYRRQLRAYCSRLVGVERAQDAVQQALL